VGFFHYPGTGVAGLNYWQSLSLFVRAGTKIFGIINWQKCTHILARFYFCANKIANCAINSKTTMTIFFQLNRIPAGHDIGDFLPFNPMRFSLPDGRPLVVCHYSRLRR
jgi:hypothetical protein